MSKPIRALPCPDGLCSAPNCLGDVLELAPVPLCPRHVRETYEFAAALVNDRWATALGEAHAAERERVPIVDQDRLDRLKVRPDGFVYFIRFDGRIKIGWSANPQVRIRNLPHDEVLAIVPGTVQDERAHHAKFGHLRTNGEWFRAEPDLIDFIAALERR